MTLRPRILVAVTLPLLFACMTTNAGAQWIDHPTPGIPRTADGKPDLKAPAPRTVDGKPDFSGLWQIDGLGTATNITKTEMLPWAQLLYRQRLQTYANDDPAIGCLPEGPRTSLAGLDPLRIIQTPAIVAVLYETGPYRQIFTDGRSLPKDPTPTWMGYSVGRFDGDALVVETAGYNDKTWLDFTGHPHTEALQVTERFRRIDFGHARLEMTFDDPKAYVMPWTISVGMTFLPDTELIENVCLENEKDRHRLVGRIDDEKKSEKKLSSGVLSRYAGQYDAGPLGTWNVSVGGDQLMIEFADGGGRQAAFAQSETVFVFPPIGGTVTFAAGPTGSATHFVLTVVEGDFKAMRKE